MASQVSEFEKRLYDRGMEVLKEHDEKLGDLIDKSKETGKGVIGWKKDNPDMVREEKLGNVLEHLLWILYHRIKGIEGDTGCCGQKCIECGHGRYGDGMGRWYCQEECECK